MKRFFFTLGIIAVLLSILIVIAPNIGKNYFNKHSYELIGRKATIDQISFNPFVGSATIDHLTVMETDSLIPFSGWRQLYININLLKLITGKIQVEEIKLDSPFVHVINDHGILNFDDLIKQDTIQKDEESDPVNFEIINLRMSKGTVTYYESAIDHLINMDNLSFSLPKFAWNSSSAEMALDFIINESGILTVENHFYPEKNGFVCNTKLINLDLEVTKPYSYSYVDLEDYSGKLGFDLEIRGEFADTSYMTISGKSWLTHFIAKDTASTPMLEIDSAGLEIRDIDVFNEQYLFEKLYIKNPFLRFDLVDTLNNYYAVFAPMLTDEDSLITVDSIKTVSASNMYYSIDTILVTNGAIKYRDFTFPEVYEYDIKEILAIAENFRSDSSSISKITSQGKLREKGNYNAIMTVNPLYPLDFSIEFAVEGFQMADISPFALFYAGHPVFEGEMIYSGMTEVNQGVMKSDNKITVYDLQVGDKVSKNTLYAMPLKFAVFLLKDKNGVVNLDLPVEGNLEDPKFKFGPLIWQIIRQNAAKITAAPGRALASQFGLNEAELKYIDFPMLDSTLTDSAKITLDNLITLVNKKPGLIVDLKYYIPSEDEMNELALHQAKRFYLQTKLGINEEEKLHLAAEKLPDTDEHFTLFVNEKLETEGKPADSLSVVFIGMENLLGKMDQIRKNRESATLNYVRATDSLAVDKFIFSESDYFPEFPVSNTGYLVNFSIE